MNKAKDFISTLALNASLDVYNNTSRNTALSRAISDASVNIANKLIKKGTKATPK